MINLENILKWMNNKNITYQNEWDTAKTVFERNL